MELNIGERSSSNDRFCLVWVYIICITIPCVLFTEINTCRCEILGDINNNDVIGLEEAIYALEVVAGVRTMPIFFANYLPTDPNLHCLKTFSWTYGKTGQYTSKIEGFEKIPYNSGQITGVKISNPLSDATAGVFYNRSGIVQFLMLEDSYVSTDCTLTSHPSGWAFGKLYHGQVIDQGTYYGISKDLWECEEDEQKILITIQNVTLPAGDFENAVLMWSLDLDKPFTPLNLKGKDADVGIVLPASIDTQGVSVTAVDIFGYATGLIAGGDIDASTGELEDFCELISVSCAE